MEKLKVFEEFIFETSSRKLDSINKSLSSFFDSVNYWCVRDMLYLILCVVKGVDTVKEISDECDGWIDNIISHESLTQDMDKSIETFKEITKYNNNKVKTPRFIETMNEYNYKSLESIEKILKSYKEKKKTDKVKYHDFVEYFFKIGRVIRKTDKNAKASHDNILKTILDNGIDVMNIIGETKEYANDNRKDQVIILSELTMEASEEMEDDKRYNNAGKPVMITTLWNGKAADDGMITFQLFIEKNKCNIVMGYVGQLNTLCIKFDKNGVDSCTPKDKNLHFLYKKMSNLERLFNKDKFKKILEDIIEIFAKNGAKVEFDYDDVMKNLEKYK